MGAAGNEEERFTVQDSNEARRLWNLASTRRVAVSIKPDISFLLRHLTTIVPKGRNSTAIPEGTRTKVFRVLVPGTMGLGTRDHKGAPTEESHHLGSRKEL